MANIRAGRPSASTSLGSTPRASNWRTLASRSFTMSIHHTSGAAAITVAPTLSAASPAASLKRGFRVAAPSDEMGFLRSVSWSVVMIASMSLRGSLAEQGEKVLGSALLDFRHRDAPQIGDLFRDVPDLGRIVALAPKRNRRKKRRVGLDQHALKRDTTRDFLQIHGIAKSDDARERNIEVQVHRRLGDFPGFSEAMHDAPRLLSAFLGHDAQRVLGR